MRRIIPFLLFAAFPALLYAQPDAERPPTQIFRQTLNDDLPDPNLSIARQWNELLLHSIRNDFARPTVHARNLFHLGIAMYDAWAAYDGNTFALGKRFGGFEFPFDGVPEPANIEEARREAISYAAYRLLKYRFANAPDPSKIMPLLDAMMERNGYPIAYSGMLYAEARPAALGNYIADLIIQFGKQDGSNEVNSYVNQYYEPVNEPFRPDMPGNGTMTNPNRWQPLVFLRFVDQSGNELTNSPEFLGAEWGYVTPFALPATERKIVSRDGHEYWLYLDPGAPPGISDAPGLEDPYKWHHTMVAVWGSHLEHLDETMIDISPGAMGNNGALPETEEGRQAFYNYLGGGDHSQGYELNPVTGEPYESQVVRRGDFSRVLAEFWADGPDSETPPGHWFTILNYVNDHPDLEKRMQGQGEILPPLEWDVKAYLVMGGAMHDAAVAAWSVKGYYDYVRPISAIRYMASQGQSSDPALPHYHEHGMPLIDGFVELIKPGDPLAGSGNEHVNDIKVYSWRGHESIRQDGTAGVGWLLGESWISYQRSTFVTPPFAGYVSGHSTFSRAAAEVLSLLTGSEYFPGGLGEFVAPENAFLVFEKGPSMELKLQWARYQDASDQSSLSRIWGGIHPPADDLPGRRIGIKVGHYAFEKALGIFNGEMVTGIDESHFPGVVFYPNPATPGEFLNIDFNSGIRTVNMRDVSGKLIFSQELVNASGFDIPAVPPGLYLVEITSGNRRYQGRLVIRN